MTMITPSYLGETIEYSSLHACRSTLEDPTLAGGPPCQPFSIGGKHQGPLDSRDMFPEVVRAMRELQPKAVLVENVRGLLRESFAKYFEYVTLQMRYPEMAAMPDEDWTEHLSRLERHYTRGREKGLHYNIVYRPLNAANYGCHRSASG